jgi:hypothetical protein
MGVETSSNLFGSEWRGLRELKFEAASDFGKGPDNGSDIRSRDEDGCDLKRVTNILGFKLEFAFWTSTSSFCFGLTTENRVLNSQADSCCGV